MRLVSGSSWKALGVRLQRDITDLASGRGIDLGQRPTAISDEDAIGLRINANIVRVARRARFVRWTCKLSSIKQPHGAVAGVGHIERVGRRFVADALGFLQSRNPVDHLTIGEIDNSNAVVAKLGDKETLPLQVDRHVVDAATHVAHWNLGFELKRARVSGQGWADQRCQPAQPERRLTPARFSVVDAAWPNHPPGTNDNAPADARSGGAIASPKAAEQS